MKLNLPHLIIADGAVDLAGDLTAFLDGVYQVTQVTGFRQAIDALAKPFSVLIIAADFCLEPGAVELDCPCTAGTMMTLALAKGHSVLTLGVVPEAPAARQGRQVIGLDRYPDPQTLKRALERLIPQKARTKSN